MSGSTVLGFQTHCYTWSLPQILHSIWTAESDHELRLRSNISVWHFLGNRMIYFTNLWADCLSEVEMWHGWVFNKDLQSPGFNPEDWGKTVLFNQGGYQAQRYSQMMRMLLGLSLLATELQAFVTWQAGILTREGRHTRFPHNPCAERAQQEVAIY